MSFDWFQANYFSFNSIWYQQLEGLPQGGSASGLLATLFLDSRLEIYYNLIFSAHHLKAWWKFVDDMLVYMPKTNVLDFVSAFSHWTGFEVTHEDESMNDSCSGCPTISFLDYNISRTPTQFLISLYLKPTASHRIVHYTTYGSKNSKRTALLYHLRRVLFRSSDVFLSRDMSFCIQMIKNNGYPHSYIISELSDLVRGYVQQASSNRQPYTACRHSILSHFILSSKNVPFPRLLSKQSMPRFYLRSIVYSCEEISSLIQSAFGTYGIPTFSKPETLFTKLSMSLRDIHPTSKLSTKHRILLTSCTACGLGFLCTGKGNVKQILINIKEDPDSPINKHFSVSGHSNLSSGVELPYTKQLSQNVQILIYKQIYTSMGIHLDDTYNYNTISRFLALGWELFI
ncbi:uncharacterized protein LOC119672073 [Teleopsis dalmanni]|uniref:uncharacterized protein LOC119672073 n=1 Tax=Teleopsis dalmanni TaxID=139649 RepID=UPI0018CCA5AB|nr:uncharacterized protein LOC119672073 [Teleopsis dalmanni]